MPRRTELVAALKVQRFDLLVVGGGIVGAGLARDAAMRGLRVALVDQRDFAGGTSSKTSKLIHGGLRYLEQGRLGLVRQSLQERDILRTIAPQLVWPLSFLMPVYRKDPRSAWKIAAGLSLYDWLAGHRKIRAHRMLSVREALRKESRLETRGLRAVASYTDCQMDDARLCLANILQAVSFGAVCCNYVKLLEFKKTSGRVCGAVVEDLRSRGVFEIQATVVVNATGPWSDAVRALSGTREGPRLKPTKGSHLVVPRLSPYALFVQAKRDGRMLFVLPLGDYSLIGTTETPEVSSLDELHASVSDVEYLLAEVNRVLPEAALQPTDIVGTFSGARPLLAFSGSPREASRGHRIEVDSSGLISVLGGKFTTYRLVAQETIDLIFRGRRPRTEKCLTDQVSLLEPTHPIVLDRWQHAAARVGPEAMNRLLAVYGTGAFRILQLVEFEPSLARPVCPHHEVMHAELVHAMQEELACTVTDILVRRTRIAYSACQGLDSLSTLVDVLQRYSHLSREQLDQQIDDYRHVLANSLSFLPASPAGLRSSSPLGSVPRR